MYATMAALATMTPTGKSGLGLAAQREALARFAAAEDLQIAAEFIEVETGKGSDALDRRPQLAAALAEARKMPGASLAPLAHGLAMTAISAEHFRDLAELRLLLEGHAMQVSLANADVEWEGRVVSAHHKLASPSG